jgi:hypothetical protein
MEISNERLEQVIDLMKECDGEDMEHVIEQVGMTGQMQKQLTCTANPLDMYNLVLTWADNIVSDHNGGRRQQTEESIYATKVKDARWMISIASVLSSYAEGLLQK